MRKNLLSFIEDSEKNPDQIALAHRSGLRAERWSYRRLRETAFQFARELESYGIEKGDRVLFWGENSPEWVAGFFGCLSRGVIVVPLDFESSPEFAARVQLQVQAKLVLYSGDRFRESKLTCIGIQLESLADEVSSNSASFYEANSIGEDDIAEIIFTSGTTADPKGVCITHKNILANINPLEKEIQKYLRYERFVHPVRFLNLLPLSHVFGQFMGIFVPQLLASEIYFQTSLNPSEIIATVKKNRISVIVSVPRVLDTLKAKIERDYEQRGESSSLENLLDRAEKQHFLRRWWTFRRVHRQFGWKFWAFVSGGAALNAETETFWRRLGYAIVQGYGMTETASVVTVNHPFNLSRRSIGKALPGQEVKLGEGGEILVRGGSVSPGYWNSAEQRLTNEEGWLRTGDIAEIDSEGNLFFKSRKKDVIVTAAGLNIYPDDLEAALNSQPGVRDSAVVGIETAQGPEPLAVLLLTGDESNPAEIVAEANRSLSQYQQIRRWVLWPEEDFPRTPTKKIRKIAVLEKIKQPVGSSIGTVGTKAGSSFIARTIARVSGDAPVDLDPSANLERDLKLDSLGRVELLSAIEDHYQIDIDESAFTAATTIGDIEKMIRSGPVEQTSRYEYPGWSQRFPMTWIRLCIFYLVILPLTKLMSRATVIGRERVRNVRGPLLMISNHITMVDAALILLALPRQLQRKLAIAMEGEVLRAWRHPPKGAGLFRRIIDSAKYFLVTGLFNAFPLPQKSGYRRSFAYAGDAMDRGYSVLVFPEGRRTTDGEMKPFMEGIGLLALNLNVPVLPVRIDGLFELKQSKTYFAKQGQLKITIGSLLTFSPGDDASKIARELEGRVSSL